MLFPAPGGFPESGAGAVFKGFNVRRVAWLRFVAAACLVLFAGDVFAQPATLPRYDLLVDIDTTQHKGDIRQRVTWTNTTRRAQGELVFNFYPHYRIPVAEKPLLA